VTGDDRPRTPVSDRGAARRVARALAGARPAGRSHAQTGPSDGEIDELEQRFDTVFSDELRCWWRWQDGAPRPVTTRNGRPWTLETQPGPELLTAEGAIFMAESMRRADEHIYDPTDPEPLRSWWPDWVPITCNISGGVLACETGRPRHEPCRVRYVHYGNTDIPPAVTAESLGQIVTWWIELYDRGYYHYDEKTDMWLCNDAYEEDFPGPHPGYAGG